MLDDAPATNFDPSTASSIPVCNNSDLPFAIGTLTSTAAPLFVFAKLGASYGSDYVNCAYPVVALH